MTMTGSLSLMLSSLAERAVSGDAFQWGLRENSGQKLSLSIYHYLDCVNLKEAYSYIRLRSTWDHLVGSDRKNGSGNQRLL